MASVITNIRGIEVHYEVHNARQEQTIVFLHGFTGSTRTWDEVIEQLPTTHRLITIDLVGHGQTGAPKLLRYYSMQEQVEILEAFFEWKQIEQFDLIGYSMGGRVALSYAMNYPQRIHTLILENASPGLKTIEEREQRIQLDHLLADRIEQRGIVDFVDYWQDIPLFQTQKLLSEEKQHAIRQERLNQQEIGLANSLRGMGTGQQNSYWPELSKFEKNVVLLNGELDSKFITISEQMKGIFPNAQQIVVPKVGHAIHVENPQSFATIVKEQLHL